MNRVGRKTEALLAMGVVWLTTSPAAAMFLDENRLFKLTANAYTQTRVRMQKSDPPKQLQGGGTVPDVDIGDLIQWRNYAYPVFEGDLGGFFGWRWIDNLSFRFGGRFIYEGVYDFGASQFRRELRMKKVSANSPGPHPSPTDPNGGVGLGGNEPIAIYRGDKPVEANDGGIGICGDPSNAPFFSPLCLQANPVTRAARLRDQEFLDPRNLFTQRTDPWEIYLNIEKRPFFFRIGRQALSWGESDGQRLLDEINPLDRLFGLPFDEDLDEQRIPNWMIRGNLQLINSWGPLSSFGIESFLVPGIIDATQNPLPLLNDYPYGPPAGCDPQFIANEAGKDGFGGDRPAQEGCTRTIGGFLPTGTVQASLYEKLPRHKWTNSRFGVRFLGILFRDYTFSVGAYRSWADIPQPKVHYTDLIVAPGCTGPDFNSPPCVTPPLPTHVVAELTHGQVDVIGGTLSFFQPRLLPGVVRAEVGYFMDEPALVPIANLGHIPLLENFQGGLGPEKIFIDTFVPTADYLRWVIGYDVFQLNVPWISQTNNIIMITQWFSSLNLSGNGLHRLAEANGVPELGDFDAGASQPDGTRTKAPQYQSLGNITFQAFMMHGLLVPQITFVGDIQGWGAVLPNVTYRFTDSLLVKVGYTSIFGAFKVGGLFRDRDQIGARVTYQLN